MRREFGWGLLGALLFSLCVSGSWASADSSAASPVTIGVQGRGYAFFATDTGLTSIYRERTVSNGKVETDTYYALTVLGPAAFAGVSEATRVERAYDGEDDLAYLYFVAVPNGLIKLGEEWGSRSSPKTLMRPLNPAPTYPLLKVGGRFATQQEADDGELYTLTMQALRTETVTVPAGTYEALKVEVTWSTKDKSTKIDTYWLGPNGIGVVKERTVDASTPESVWYQEVELEAGPK